MNYSIICYNEENMAKIILAVSGGVDSMVMLDMICRSGKYSSGDIIIGHFDHGMRENSALDAEFVRRKAKEYGVEFRLGKGELGKKADEAMARKARYEFLKQIEPGAMIFTAHHLDDLVETVAINLVRGTSWRGLGGLSRAGIRRPFLERELIYEPMDKAAIFEYAAKRKLEFREDQSNSSDEYLRNRIRHGTNNSIGVMEMSFEQKMVIFELWQRQKALRAEIDAATAALLPDDGVWERKWFQRMEELARAEVRAQAQGLAQSQGAGETREAGRVEEIWEGWRLVALELLRAGTLRAGIQATRPQLEEFRQAILNYAPGKRFNLPGDKLVKLNKEDFEL